jgi:hypothetical protein
MFSGPDKRANISFYRCLLLNGLIHTRDKTNGDIKFNKNFSIKNVILIKEIETNTRIVFSHWISTAGAAGILRDG